MRGDAGPGYVVERSGEDVSLVLTGPFTDRAATRLREGGIDGLVVNYAKGFVGPDLGFLAGLHIRRLDVLDRTIVDLTPIEYLGDSLVELSVEAAPGAELNLAAFSRLQSISGEWGLLRPSIGSVEVEQIITWRFVDEHDLVVLIDQSRLRKLIIKEARQLESLRGVAALELLEVLQIQRAPLLSDISDLSELMNSLVIARFNGCPHIDTLDAFAPLHRLRCLEVGDCSAIESLQPIAALACLEEFWAWGTTNIADSDLSVLRALPRLREVRMQSRRGYRPPLKAIEEGLRR